MCHKGTKQGAEPYAGLTKDNHESPNDKNNANFFYIKCYNKKNFRQFQTEWVPNDVPRLSIRIQLNE